MAMKLGIVASPIDDWQRVLAAARAADEAGVEAIGFWDHYQSLEPGWGYVCGWSAYGAIAQVTSRIHLVPMVLNLPHYQLGVLAKESAVLSAMSDGRFELGVGAGDWPDSFRAWGEQLAPAADRVEQLEEAVAALRRLWTGEPVAFAGRHVHLVGAISAPPPPTPPRIVVGVGASSRLLDRASAFADEVNVYPDERLLADALDRRRAGGPHVSVHLAWMWDDWPADPFGELARLRDRGVDRAFVAIGGEDPVARVEELAKFA